MELEFERKEITKDIIHYHDMAEGKEKDDELERLIRITEELIYLAPVERGYISEADACGFYLEQRKNARKILEAYRISQLEYPEYIAQIMRVRVRNYLLHKRENESDIKRLHYAEHANGENCYVMDIEDIYEADRKSTSSVRKDGVKTTKTIKEAFTKVLRDSEKVNYKDRNLRRKSVRYGLLCMLLSLPKGEGYDYIDHYAEMLHVNEDNVVAILRLRDEYDENRNSRVEKHREVIGKHFKILLRLNTAYKLSDDEEEKKKLCELSLRLEELIGRRCERMKHENAGFTQREMATILGTSRSTISSDIRKARIYLYSKLTA